ncbi:hypothetical protein LTR60_000717 [Cryomyces antarcticus]|nr:hypothetical protein LTR39_000884 [Cryomyces antarcticus]KAK5020218.1 hypothetical protein LTR60_000717 [Cryomyces antarcticus]
MTRELFSGSYDAHVLVTARRIRESEVFQRVKSEWPTVTDVDPLLFRNQKRVTKAELEAMRKVIVRKGYSLEQTRTAVNRRILQRLENCLKDCRTSQLLTPTPNDYIKIVVDNISGTQSLTREEFDRASARIGQRVVLSNDGMLAKEMDVQVTRNVEEEGAVRDPGQDSPFLDLQQQYEVDTMGLESGTWIGAAGDTGRIWKTRTSQR